MIQEEITAMEELAQGALNEMFQRELKRVLANIANVNNVAKAKREIVIKIGFMPYDDRSGAQLILSSEARLAKDATVGTRVLLAHRGDTVQMFSNDLNQTTLFTDPGGNTL